jgi:hypothetical protein
LAVLALLTFTKSIFDHNVAYFAAAAFALQAPVLFLSRFATHDAMSIMLLAAAIALTVPISRSKRPWLGAPLLAAVLTFAVITKYAILLFVPSVLALLVVMVAIRQGVRLAVLSGVVAGLATVAGVALFFWLDPAVLAGLSFTTTERSVIIFVDRLSLLSDTVRISGILVVLSLLGAIFTARSRITIALLLLATAFLVPAYHLYKGELVSYHKHLAYSSLFLAPVAGVFLAKVSGYQATFMVGTRWIVGLAIVLGMFAFGLNQAIAFFHEWPNATAMNRILLTQVRDTSRLLSEESEVPRYYLQDHVQAWQWSNLYWFEYPDANGAIVRGFPAYQRAIDDEFFDLIVLRYGPNYDVAVAIRRLLVADANYELISNQAVNSPEVWRRVTRGASERVLRPVE